MSPEMSRRGFLLGTAGLGALLGGSSLLSACGSSASGTSSASAMDMWWFFNSPDNQKWFQDNIVSAFNAKQGSGAHVNLIGKPLTFFQLEETLWPLAAVPTCSRPAARTRST